ncbi:DUF4240 domain-containing protein [Micromonospora sp. NPDC004704]
MEIVVRGRWHEEHERELARQPDAGLVMSHASGFSRSKGSLAFLDEVGPVSRIRALIKDPVDLGPILRKQSLQSLQLVLAKKTKIDLAGLTGLRSLSVDGVNQVVGLERLASLEDLITPAALLDVGGAYLRKLRRLSLLDARQLDSLMFLANAARLTDLEVHGAGSDLDLAGVGAGKLASVTFSDCNGVVDWRPLFVQGGIDRIVLENCGYINLSAAEIGRSTASVVHMIGETWTADMKVVRRGGVLRDPQGEWPFHSPLSLREFWRLIGAHLTYLSEETVGNLIADLSLGPVRRILGFADRLAEAVYELDTADLFEQPVYSQEGGGPFVLTDDGFMDFRYDIVANGETIYGRVKRDSLAATELMARPAAENLLDVADRAYRSFSGQSYLHNPLHEVATGSNHSGWPERVTN